MRGKMKLTIIAALAFAFAAHAQKSEQKVATLPFNPPQVQQQQDFNARVQKINKEREEMQRTWNAELKVVQLEYQEWLAQQCKAMKSEACAANTQDADSSKWTWALPEQKPAPVIKPPETANKKE
jgi:hypothetical protein